MKKFYTTLVALALAASHLAAQNWSPLTLGETHHFRLPDSTHITHTIRIDSSLTLSNGNTIFFLNRVLRHWDAVDSTYAWVNQGQSLGQTATRRADGSWVFEGLNKLTDVLNLTIIPTANVGQSWVSNASMGQTASVTAAALSSVLGQPDSVKTIQFSDGATWLLSKSHGLLRCPDPFTAGLEVQLSGLKIKQLGDRLYRFEDFFTYEVGDVFEIWSSDDGLGGGTSEHSKRTVIQRKLLSDGVEHTFDRYAKFSSYGFGGTQNWTRHDTITETVLRTAHPHIGTYPNQAIHVMDWWGFMGTAVATFRQQELHIGAYLPILGGEACGMFYALQPNNVWAGSSQNLLACRSGQLYQERYRVGVGPLIKRVSVIDNTIDWHLIGAVMSGDTVWGKISPDWLFTSTQTPDGGDRVLRIAPNPAQDEAFVQVPETIENEPLAVQIFSLDGRLLRQFDAQPEGGSVSLDLSGISPQTCLMALRTRAGVWHGRVVKGR